MAAGVYLCNFSLNNLKGTTLKAEQRLQGMKRYYPGTFKMTGPKEQLTLPNMFKLVSALYERDRKVVKVIFPSLEESSPEAAIKASRAYDRMVSQSPIKMSYQEPKRSLSQMRQLYPPTIRVTDWGDMGE